MTSCVCTCREFFFSGKSQILSLLCQKCLRVTFNAEGRDVEMTECFCRIVITSVQRLRVVVKLGIHELLLTLFQKESRGNINTVSSTQSHHAETPTLTHTHTQTCAYRMYFKSLMCKQLLLFAQTTCSFWTQTKLWRTMGCVNSVGCVGDALHERSISTWCRLHQMVGPGRTAASSNRTHTDLQKNGASSARNTPTCFCFFLRSATFLRRGGTAGDARHYISLKETRDGFVLALTFVCKVKTEEGGKKKKTASTFGS